MTNKIELPDLDRLLTACRVALVSLAHAAEKHGIYQTDYERFAAVVDEFAARRAQPEGEARCVICGSTEPRTGTCGSDDPRALCKSPAGQPEGEAPQAERDAILEEAANLIEMMPCSRDSVQPMLLAAKALRALKITAPAAQHAESGAPAAVLSGEQLYAMVTSRFQSGRFPWSMVAESGKAAWNSAAADLTFAPDTIGAALAAQSQGAQAARPECQAEPGAWSECQRRTIELYTTLQGPRAAAGRAQQAAAPGLTTARQHKIAELLRIYDEQGGDWCKIARAVESRYVDADSAPGTPEAQASFASWAKTRAAYDVLVERWRQVEVEGWTASLDDGYLEGELSIAAACYALQGDAIDPVPPEAWPWSVQWWKPAGARRNLVKAGALILAEIERLDRTAQLDTAPEAPKGGEL